MTAFLILCILVNLNAGAYYAYPIYGYSNQSLNSLYKDSSPESPGNSVNGLFPVFPWDPAAGSIYSLGGLFSGFDNATTNTGIGNNNQANPAGNIQNTKSVNPESSIYPYGLANLFNPLLAAGFPYSGLNYPPMGLPITGLFPEILSVTSGMGFPGMLFPGIQTLGGGFSGMGPLWLWDTSALFAGGGEGSDNQDISPQQPSDLSENPKSRLLNPFGNLVSGFSAGALYNPASSLISPLATIIPPFDSTLRMANLNTKMYVAASIEGANQAVYILLLDNGMDSDISLEDILVNGIHCIKATDVSNTETSIKHGKDNYSLSLYLEVNTGKPIWAWSEKWW
ncbi:MAG: hypothetical protein ACMUIU_08965 [bacterium]